ncbi:enoyl-CoA hydratase [Vibrio panuliri]|uniref:Enoyl-CoA hydratase n=1 Tax=Vibrio panuliri TaxID=1381081 RepID=A0ABX3FU68_9VIBR|nr:enoyl-CoA hydratase [Vibrio panuliri]KAB1457323.1 enoyl-CoA hydratase [Vibrio panuliri]OLQ96317.1 enoyl-CoA hydratase [Vibrio panuliri]
MTELIKLERTDHIAQVTINNPPANTWTLASLKHLKSLALELSQDRTIYALVITGQGSKFFSAGADLNTFASGDKSQALDMAFAFGEAFEALSAFDGVTIAAINGYAMGGGLEVALACDIRIVEQQAQLALPEASVGLLPCAGGTQNLTALVGEGWAKRMILCGERVDALTAERIGLAEQVVETGEALKVAMSLASQVAKQSPSSVSACKTLIQNHRTNTHAAGLVLERELFMQLFNTNDQQEGVNAFLQKRAPNWTNS